VPSHACHVTASSSPLSSAAPKRGGRAAASRGDDAGASGLGTTGFGTVPALDDPPAAPREHSAFDVCHAGVVLRAMLFVHGVVGLALAFVADGLVPWWRGFATASTVALPALLVWLSTACLAQRALARLGIGWQWAVAFGWGAACAAGSWRLWTLLQPPDARGVDTQSALAVALAGAAMAGAFFHWLRQRAQLRLPAATVARLAELQSRIRPHFLFNTLNTAIALVRVDPSRAETVLEDLSALFRAALADSDPHASATLGEEIDLARRYLAIEQLRFGDRLLVHWELDPKADGARLPPLLLQPLVENAVKHGVEPSAEGGVLRVRTRARRGQAELLVSNSVAPQSSSTPGHGIALRNVQERLRLLHDVAADFRARRDGDVYRVRVVVPLP
jgi:two-component system sensor histidine kinase AlgZ